MANHFGNRIVRIVCLAFLIVQKKQLSMENIVMVYPDILARNKRNSWFFTRSFSLWHEQYANGSPCIVMIKEEPVLMHQRNIDHENIGNDGNEGGHDKTSFVLILFIFDSLQEKK